MPDPLPYASVYHYIGRNLLCAIILNITPKRSPFRFLVIPLIIYSGYQQWLLCPLLTRNLLYNSMVGSFAMPTAIRNVVLLIMPGVDTADLRREMKLSPSAGLLSRVGSTFAHLIAARGIGTSWQVKNVPEFPAFYNSRIPSSRTWFLLRQTAFLAWEYILLDLSYVATMAQSSEELQKVAGPGAEFLYRDATAEQWAYRISTSILVWYIIQRAMVDGVYRLFSIISVGFGLDSPSDWPPLFGSVWDVYTLRNYWGKYWHQMLRLPFTSFTDFVLRDILHFPRPSLLERYSNISLVFILSGILHTFLEISWGIPLQDTGAMYFFPIAALGIMIEDGVQAAWRWVSGAPFAKDNDPIPLWQRLIGAAWVLVWFCMTAPWFSYTGMRLPQEDRWLVPYSVVERIGAPAAGAALGVGALVLQFGFGAEV